MMDPDLSPAKKLEKSLAERLALWRGLEKQLRLGASAPAEKTRGNLRRFSLLEAIFKLRVQSAPRAMRVDVPPSRFLSRLPEAGSRSRVLRDATLAFTGSISSTSLSNAKLEASGFEPIWRESDVRSGQVLAGRFQLGRVLAHGGMAQVFRALDRKQRKIVAVKILPPSARQFMSESRAVTQGLDHPAILKVLSSGRTDDGGIFEVLPLLRGVALRQLLDAGAPREAILLAFRRACEGVAHAHARGVLHRDLKPSNILVERDARVFVADWDFAIEVGAQDPGQGRVLGTPFYMAPEQFKSGRLDPSADVYALGLILYEILAGVHPREGGRDLEQIRHLAILENPPPPSFFNRKTPPKIEKVVLRCLRNKPSERFSGATELLEALEDAVQRT